MCLFDWEFLVQKSRKVGVLIMSMQLFALNRRFLVHLGAAVGMAEKFF